jgi:hypothetical protein
MGDEAIIGMQVVSRFTLTIDHGRTHALEPDRQQAARSRFAGKRR